MKSSQKNSTHFDLQLRSNHRHELTAKWWTSKGVLRFALPILITGAVVCTPIESRVLVRNGQQADSKAPALDPRAMEALNKMGAYLRTLKSFQVRADVSTDDVLEDGQTIQSNSKVDIVAARPNRLRIEVDADDGHRFFFFDGKNFTIFGQLVNYYATIPAPPTIAQLTEDLSNKYGIELPLLDLFEWGTNDTTISRIKGAMDVGPSTVDGITCEQYAFHQDNVDWQIWIQLGEFPLPRKLIIRTLTDDAKPQHSEMLNWNLAPSFSDDAFTFDPPADARRITLAAIEAQSKKETK
jgi:hypothetical protein